MASVRVRWVLAIGGGLAVGALLFVAPLLYASTTTVTTTIHSGSAFNGAGSGCDVAIERAGAPDAVWNASLSDGLRFRIPIPEGIGPRFGYRIEVLGNATYAPAPPGPTTFAPTQRASETMCLATTGTGFVTLGESVARGSGALYAAFWSFTAP